MATTSKIAPVSTCSQRELRSRSADPGQPDVTGRAVTREHFSLWHRTSGVMCPGQYLTAPGRTFDGASSLQMPP